MNLNPIRRAFQRGLELGEARARREHVEYLRAQAAAHHGEVGDARRRGALNAAADSIRDGRQVGRP